ncbi:MAG: matrixin family metalloprotease [Bryobacteraceae bacterium]
MKTRRHMDARPRGAQLNPAITRRGIALIAALVFTASLALANYHFVYYATSGPPYTPLFERFAVESLRGGALPFLVVDPPSTLQMEPGDTFDQVISQMRAASEVWNSVPTSTFRFRFGGMATPNVTMTLPAVVISFDELPPGVIAMAGPVTTGQVATAPDGQPYVPVIQSSMVIGPDLRSPATSSTGIGPSWSDRLFLTLVHEFGHTLGLQHTWTSSAMSTEITRATTRAHPLGADDIAAVSILYPTPAWAASYGSITGQVTMGGSGVALASVVALTPGGEAVSTLTNPDGTYEIDGLAAGSYQVYAHTVPPSLPGESYSGDVIPPTSPQGTILSGPAFNTIFQTGTSSPGDPVQVSAGAATPGVNFAVTPLSSVNICGIQTYSFLWDQAAQAYDTAKPATFTFGASPGTAVVTGDGLFSANGVNPAPGLSASVLGFPGMIQSLVAYPYGAGYLQFQVSAAAPSSPGPQHLILSQGGEVEIVPSAILLAPADPPAISSIQQNGDGTATITGSGLGPGTGIMFDGAAAAVQAASSGQLTVVVPPALPGASAAVIALSPTGLDSNFFAPAAAPPSYAYAQGQAPAIQLTPASAPAGSRLLMDITGTNVNFAAANLRFGFGSSDIIVEQITILAPWHAVAQVVVSKYAQQGPATVTLSSGLQFLEVPAGFLVTPPQAALPFAVSAFDNSLQPGEDFVLCVGGVSTYTSSSDFSVTVSSLNGDEGAAASYFSGLLIVVAPSDLLPGPVLVKVSYLGVPLPPLLFYSGGVPWPNIIQAASALSGGLYSGAYPAFPGDGIALTVQGLADSLAPLDVNSITVSVGGAPQTVTSVQQDASSGTAIVGFQLSPQTVVPAAGSLLLTVAYDSRVSAPVTLPVASQSSSSAN